jgi:hypothetical protein
MLCAVEKAWAHRGGYQETPVTPGEHDDSTPVMFCKGLGYIPGDGFVEYVGLWAVRRFAMHRFLSLYLIDRDFLNG